VQREKLKLLSTIPLALVFVYLLVNATMSGDKQPQPAAPSSATTVPGSRAAPGASPPASATPTVPTLATALAAVFAAQALPRDPFAFRPFDEAQTPLPRQPQPSADEAPSASTDEPSIQSAAAAKLHLKATLIDRYGKVAFINEQMGKEGHMVAGYTIVSITPGHVIMAQGSKVVHLRLARGGTP
jgi:hypothetical protein